jgi:hypothetical protein
VGVEVSLVDGHGQSQASERSPEAAVWVLDLHLLRIRIRIEKKIENGASVGATGCEWAWRSAWWTVTASHRPASGLPRLPCAGP